MIFREKKQNHFYLCGERVVVLIVYWNEWVRESVWKRERERRDDVSDPNTHSNYGRTQPLQLWEQKAEKHGNDDDEVAIQLIMDPEIQSSVLDIRGINLSTTYIACPADPRKTLGIILPYFALTVKNVSHSYSRTRWHLSLFWQ